MTRKIKVLEESFHKESKKKELISLMKQIKDEEGLILSRVDFDSFVEYVMIDERGFPMKQTEIHKTWTKFIENCWMDNVNPGIIAPMGHGKTNQIAIGRTLFELGRDINLRIKVICNSATNSVKRVTALKNYIEQSNTLHKLFPHLVPGYDHWTATSFNIANRLFSDIDHSIESFGVESRAVGGRADLLIFDDIVDDKSERSLAHRTMTKNNLEDVFLSRLEPKGRIILIGTLWHVDDAYSMLIGRKGWRFLIQGVSDDFKYIEEIIV